MSIASDPIEQDPRHAQCRVEVRVTRHHCGGGTGHRASVNDEQHRGTQLLCQFSGAADLIHRRATVKQPHHAFDNGDIRIGCGANKDRTIKLHPQHPPVEISRRAACGSPVMTRIDKVGPDLERLDPSASLAQGCQNRQRRRRFSDAA